MIWMEALTAFGLTDIGERLFSRTKTQAEPAAPTTPYYEHWFDVPNVSGGRNRPAYFLSNEQGMGEVGYGRGSLIYVDNTQSAPAQALLANAFDIYGGSIVDAIPVKGAYLVDRLPFKF